MGYRDLPRAHGTPVVRGFTLVEVIIAFTIAVLAIAFIQQSLSLIAKRLYVMKKQERDLQTVAQIQGVFTAQVQGLAKLLESKNVEGKNCNLMEYNGFNYYACWQDFGIQRIYLINGYDFLILPR